MIGKTVSHYRILEKLGEGGMGVVYSAEDLNLGRTVAIKFLSATANGHHFRARFLREARSISLLNHPNIATLFDYGETEDNHPFIVMELIRGKSLNDLLEASELTLANAVSIVASVADALTEAHSRGIVHRDIKPSNIIINDRGQVKVLDFGLAKQINDQLSGPSDPEARTLLATRTQSDVVVGTPLYLSPEQATSGVVDGRSDLFALGALLYETIAGRPAFAGASVMEIGAQVIHIDPPPPSTFNHRIPKELDRIALKALEKKPGARYQSAEEMLGDLETVRVSLGGAAGTHVTRIVSGARTMPSNALVTFSNTLRRPRLSIISFLIAVCCAVLIGWGSWRLLKPGVHKPTPEAARWYEKGTAALRDGAYYQASKMLQSAVQADDKFALAHARLAEAWIELDYADRSKDELLKVSTLVTDRSALPKVDSLYLNAVNAVATRDFADAIQAYTQLARLTPEEPSVYVDLGRAYERNDEIDKAIENYLKAIELNGQYATAYLRVGVLYVRKQDAASASKTFDRAETLFKILTNVEGVAEVLHQRGNLLRRLGKFDEARVQYQQALETARATNNESTEVAVLLDLSYLAYMEGNLEQSQQYAQEGTNFAQQHGLETLAVDGLNNLALGVMAKGDYTKTEIYLKQALDFALRNKAALGEALSSLNLGSLYIQQLRTDQGLPLLERALALYQQGAYRRSIANCLRYIGRARRRKGEYAKALAAYDQYKQIAEQVGDQSQLGAAYGETAAVLAEQENYPKALELYEQSFAIFKAIGGQMDLAYNLLNRAELLWRLGRYDESRALLAQSSELAEKPGGGYKPLQAAIELDKAESELSQRRFSDAIAHSKKAIDDAGDQYTDVVIIAKYTMGQAKAFSGKKLEGKQLCEDAVTRAGQTGDDALLSRAMLALAVAQYESGQYGTSFANANAAAERFSGGAQFQSEWRAWSLAAKAAQQNVDSGATQLSERATDTLNKLQQSWGAASFESYLTRPDVRFFQQKFGGSSPSDH